MRSHLFNLSSIRWKIFAIAAIATVSFAAYLTFNLIQSNHQASLLENIRDKRYPVQAKLQEAVFTLRLLQSTLQDVVITGDAEGLEEAAALQRQFILAMDAVIKLDTTKVGLVSRVRTNFVTYYNASYILALDILSGENQQSDSIERGKQNAHLYDRLVVQLDLFKAQELHSFSESVDLATARAISIVKIGAPIGLIVAALMFTLAMVNSGRIIERINKIVNALRSMARDDGDMSVRIAVDGHDEMSELAYWFNRFIARLEAMTHDSTREIRRLAYTDTLTRLPNRRLFNAHLNSEVQRAHRTGQMLAVMFLDLDNFKTVNDQLGHDAGDALVCEVANRLLSTVRGYDTVAHENETDIAEGEHLVARMGGDEFMLIIVDLESANQAAVVAERVRKIVLEPIEVFGTCFDIGVSIGIALYPDSADATEGLVIKADLAMYEAKNRGKNNFCMFDESLESAVRRNLEIETALRLALQCNELCLHFQPKIDIRSGSVVGAEALLRWTNPTLGAISPASFVPIAEKGDLIYELDLWVLHRACDQIADWHKRNLVTVPVAINVSAKQAARADLVDNVRNALTTCDLPAYALEIEITETSALSNMQQVADNIRALKELTVTVALDDFGAGHSSLSLLKYCDIDTLKIDRGFISELRAETGKPIIEAVIALAKVLGVHTVAEGIEQKSELKALRDMGCNVAQGYYFAEPMTARDFEIYMANIATTEASRRAG